MYKNFNSVRLILLTFCLVWQTYAKEIDTISFSGLTFTPLSSLHYPHQGWSTSFDFKIDNGSSVSKDDYFSLSFPTVYRIKFDDNKLTTNATLQDGSEAFECFAAQQAAYKNKDTIFKCVAIKDLSSYSSLSGSLSFGLSFSSGGSAYQYEMQNADKFHSGSMQVLLADQLSAPIQFDSANFTNDIYTIGRSTTFNSLESYYLGMSCPNGYLLGGTQTINYDRENKGYNLDCSSIQVYLSDEYNDWSLPLKADNAGAKIDCSDDTLKINMGQASADQMLWVNALQDVSDGINTIQHEVYLQYSCSNTEQKTTYETQFSTVVEYTIYQASGTGTLSGLTATSVPSSSSAVTIQTITTTTTTGWTGTYNTTYSTGSTDLSGSSGVPTEEIIYYVETPSETGTSSAETSAPETSAPETSVPETSTPKTITTTTTTGWTGTYNTTYSTGSTDLSGSSGVPTEEIIYYVETPSETETSVSETSVSETSAPETSTPETITTTTTTGWTGTYNTTYSTGSTDLSGSSGVPTEEIIYYVETPSETETSVSETSAPETSAPETSVPETSTPETITTTTTTGWTGTYNTTYSTGSIELSGSSGVPTEEIIYYVETPSETETSVSETSAPETSAPETSAPETSAPETSAPETSSAETSAPETSVPETSTPKTIATTTTTGWTGTYNTTYSTGSTDLSGSSGVPTEEIIYYVETPNTQLYQITTKLVTISSTTTIGWSGTYTTTFSTGSATFDGNNGTLTKETIYYVETPTTSVLPLSSEATLTSAIPHLVTLSTTDLNSTYITTCNCSKSVSTTNWFSSNSETITPKPAVRTRHSSTGRITKSVTTHSPKNSPASSTPASGISSTSISTFSPNITNRSWLLTSTQPTHAVFSQSSSVIFASTALSSASVSSSGASSISNIKHSTNSTYVITATLASGTPSNASETYTSTVQSSVNSTPLTNPVRVFSVSTPISISTDSWTPLTTNPSSAAKSFSSSKLPSRLTGVSTTLTAYTNTVSSPASSTLPFNFSSAAAIPTISNSTIPLASSSSGRFSLGLSLDQGSIAQTPLAQSSRHCSIPTDTSTNIVTITKNSTITKYATASVTHTVTHKINNYNCSTKTVQSLLEPYSSSSSSNTSPSLAAYSGKGFILKRSNSITALLAMLLFIL